MRIASKFRIGLLAWIAATVALVAVPTVRAGDGSPAASPDAAHAQPAGAPATEPAARSGDSPSDTAGKTTAGPTSPSPEAGDQPANATANAERSSQTTQPTASDAKGPDGPAGGPGNSAASNPPADDTTPPDSGPEQDSSVTQAANATAAAGQEGVGNSQASVQVDEPGDGSPVSQANQAQANADATAAAQTSTTSTSSDEEAPTGSEPSDQAPNTSTATSDQSAGAISTAAQSDVRNTAVNVRVGSPGDNATVDQANTADATASTSVTPPANGRNTDDESATAVATQDGATNTNVSIRVFSPGNDGAVTQTNTADAAAQTSGPDGSNAAATQTGVQNTNVSIRVRSTGTAGATTQQSAASAGSGPATGAGPAVSTTTNGIDTNLSVVVGGNALQQPGANGPQVWVWTWNWGRDESQSVDALLDTQPASWNWAWGNASTQNGGQFGQMTSRPATSEEQAGGSWTWNWSWTRDGAPNWTWQWNWAAQLPCGSCVWIWNWTWDWTGQPAQQGSDASTARTPNNAETAGQANVADADAQASVTADVTQTIVQDGAGAGGQYAGQLVTIDQAADATATATQSDVESVATANELGVRVNRVASVASATVAGRAAQDAGQTMLDERGDGAATQWSGQETDLVQRASADVRSAQQGITLRGAGRVLAEGAASTAVAAVVDQSVGQDALVAGGTTDQWAGQLTLVEQGGDTVSLIGQSGTAAPLPVAGTARASSASGAFARVGQNVVQRAARGGGAASQTAMQAAYVGQDGSAAAATTQQAGSARSTLATSDASATNRALVVQDGAQESVGTSGLDIQDLTQQSIVVQVALAASTSAGGIAGRAVVGNCAIVQQGAVQSIAGGLPAATSADLSAFCAPPAAAPTGIWTPAESAPASSTAAVGLAVELGGATAPPDDDVALFHTLSPHRPSAAALRVRAMTPRFPSVRSGPGVGAERSLPGSASITQISVPPPTQARFDTRPGDHAGAGDAGTEPPLPPAGDPPAWVSALAAAAASGAGSSGIAAILAAFALVPPLLLRAREGSAVRRPIDVLSRVDVPV